MRRQKALALGTGVAAAVLAAGVPAAEAQTAAAASAASWHAQCVMDKDISIGPWLGNVRSTFDVTFQGSISGSTGTVRSASYSFEKARFYLLNGVFIGYVERGNRSNINVKSPVTRNSPDSLPPIGTWDLPDFTFTKGTNISAQGILDLVDVPDPSCTATVRADWSLK